MISTFFRVPPTSVNNDEDKTALDMWLQTIRHVYDAECMTTLQCKSIALELAEKVDLIASKLIITLRAIIQHARLIEQEFTNIET